MSIWRSICNIFASAHNSVDEALKDPERDTKIAVERTKALIAKRTEERKRARAATIQLERDIAAKKLDAEKYGNLADAAMAKAATLTGDDAVRAEQNAERLLAEQTRVEEELATLERELGLNKKTIEDTDRVIAQMQLMITNVQSKQERNSTRIKNAKMRQELANAQNDDDGGIIAELAALEKAADKEEAMAQASEETVSANPQNELRNLESEYGQPSTKVSDKLAALRAKHAKQA